VDLKRELYVEQAPGHVIKGANGKAKVCKVKVGMQGGIDAAFLFGSAIAHSFVTRVCARRTTWDPELWIVHYGPDIPREADLEKILAACATRPATDGAPPGWMTFGRHVDDGIGAAGSILYFRVHPDGRVPRSRADHF
jgi:hypothetical protein